MNKSYVVIGLSLFFVPLGAGDTGRAIGVQDGTSAQFVDERFARIGSALGNMWDIFGLIQSITIQPIHLARFFDSVIADAIRVLDEVVQLAAYCNVCSNHCSPFLAAFEDVGDRFAGVTESFRAVCVPESGCEGRVISELIQRATERFDSCWAAALKVDAAPKADH